MQIESWKKLFLDKEDPFTDIVGQLTTKMQIKSALLMGRHILVVGPPGIGKTTIAKNVSKLLPDSNVHECGFHCTPEKSVCPPCIAKKAAGQTMKTKHVRGEERFVRIQGSPDLTAEDLIGDIDPVKALQYGPMSLEAFSPGKIFKANNGILFFDELNRCPEKLQNALLQVLAEGVATIGSYEIDIAANFIFIATMNPRDTSTEKLSDVLLDRFDVVYMHYPETSAIEIGIVKQKGQKLLSFPEDVLETTITFVRNLRNSKKLEKFPSVRASLGLYERAQANAFLKGKKEVDFGDVEEVMASVLSHRIKMKPAAEYAQSPTEFIKEEFGKFCLEQKKAIEMGDST